VHQLRLLQMADAPILFDTIQQHRKELRRYLPWVDHTSMVKHSEQFIQHMTRKAYNQEALAFGIWYADQFLGIIDIHSWDHSYLCAEIGYWIRPDWQGKGLVLESTQALLQYCFEKLRLNKIAIRFVLDNKRSAQIPIRLGFFKEGIIRKSDTLHGSLVDVVVMGLLRSEWEDPLKLNKFGKQFDYNV
jgi:ribosomal-protein-serine acetyltransferase